MTINHDKHIPQKIWFLWFQGLESAPALVQKCFASWQQQNPKWEIILLTDDNLNDYLKLDLTVQQQLKLSRAHLADLIRLKLLSTYGGVWVDATSFCVQPLDEWLGNAAPSGFFAFRNPGKDRLLSNWFLGANAGNPIVTKLYNDLIVHWQSNHFANRQKDFLTKLLKKLLNNSPKTTKFWSSWFITKILKVSPYYIFHYKFTDLITRDRQCQAIWSGTQHIEADPAHQLKKNIGIYTPLSTTIAQQIDSLDTPVHKLNWKVKESESAERCVLDYLYETQTLKALT